VSTAASYAATADEAAAVAAPARAPAPPPPRGPAANPNGAVLGVVPRRPAALVPSDYSTNAAAASPRAAAQTQVTYHNGPVVHSSSVYTLFWAPSGYAFPANYAQIVNQYFNDVAHDNWTTSNVYGSVVQYYETNPKRFVSYNILYRGPTVDTSPFPKSGCPNYTLADNTQSTVCLTRAQLQNKVASFASSHSIPSGLGTEIFLFTPQGVASCTTPTSLTSGGCYNPIQYNGYCAFHSHIGSGDQAVVYANMSYDAIQGCTSGQSPNGNAADAVLNNIAHEHNESMTDPLGTGWYDNAGHEIADKCHLNFGKALGSTSTGKYNQLINGHGYWLQTLWSNRAHACVQWNTFPQPSASFTFSPTQPKRGKKVAFKSSVNEAGISKWSYRWTFPDGATATAANPSHVFQTIVFQGNVVLVVADPKGDQTRVVRSITVQ